MYPNLKLQMWKTGMRQNRLAQLVGIHETLLSKILNGFREPDGETRARIAAVLHRDALWLFTLANTASETRVEQNELANRQSN
jgi:transcriptional regulator with XRE-family HTH domain